mmetsp:Transcript_10525/g.36979  ORF Transcript_10525/g.36979 Transcript_10525/m.36979 type:complete len:254 (+) Transcript_10525:2753-3514(+)
MGKPNWSHHAFIILANGVSTRILTFVMLSPSAPSASTRTSSFSPTPIAPGGAGAAAAVAAGGAAGCGAAFGAGCVGERATAATRGALSGSAWTERAPREGDQPRPPGVSSAFNTRPSASKRASAREMPYCLHHASIILSKGMANLILMFVTFSPSAPSANTLTSTFSSPVPVPVAGAAAAAGAAAGEAAAAATFLPFLPPPPPRPPPRPRPRPFPRPASPTSAVLAEAVSALPAGAWGDGAGAAGVAGSKGRA